MKICLNAIVKDEANGIHVMLESVASFIDYYVIVDTGSTDDTKKIIKEYFDDKGIEGEIHDKPWYDDFGKSRTEALELAKGKGDYLLLMDATDRFVGVPKLDVQDLKDGYYVNLKHGNTEFNRKVIVKNDEKLEWKYVGVLHEYIMSPHTTTVGRLKDCGVECNVVVSARDSNPNKYLDDIRVLQKGLEDEPDNVRYQFYLAQSYRNVGMYEKAIETYMKRIKMGGWREELYDSHYNIGLCMMNLSTESETIEKWMADTVAKFPHRAEPLHALAVHFRKKNNFEKAYRYAKLGVGIPYPHKDILFVRGTVYDYELKDELAIASHYVGNYHDSIELWLDIIDKVPESYIPRLINNMKLSSSKLSEVVSNIRKLVNIQ